MNTSSANAPSNDAQQLQTRIAQWEAVIRQYEREIDIVSGTVRPESGDYDEVTFLARLAPSHRRQAFLDDRKLRVKILRAGIDLMQEMREPDEGRVGKRAPSKDDGDTRPLTPLRLVPPLGSRRSKSS